MSDTLLPCPFCGGEAIINDVEPHTHYIIKHMPDYLGGTFIECVACTCGIGGEEPRESIIAAWNRRTPPPPVPLTVEQLREMVGEPVWVSDLLIPNCSAWHFVIEQDVEILLVDRYALASGNVAYNATTGHNYGKTWLAYDRKPEGEPQ